MSNSNTCRLRHEITSVGKVTVYDLRILKQLCDLFTYLPEYPPYVVRNHLKYSSTKFSVLMNSVTVTLHKQHIAHCTHQDVACML